MFSMTVTRRLVTRRLLHSTSHRAVITPLTMPALSPTMTEGSVTEWKVAVGEPFKAGDVLLSIETDKAAIDVEAMDDGVMGKILVKDGTSGVEVGATIALLAEEDDDISNIALPTEVSPPPPAPSPPTPTATVSAPTPAAPSPPTPAAAPAPSHAHPTHPLPLLPSVMRLLSIAKITDATVITPTGHKGMLTKGDVLAYLGQIKSAQGSEENVAEKVAEGQKPEKKVEVKPVVEMDGPTLRRLIAVGLGSTPMRGGMSSATLTFDEILGDYAPPRSARSPTPVDASSVESVPSAKKDSFDSFLDM